MSIITDLDAADYMLGKFCTAFNSPSPFGAAAEPGEDPTVMLKAEPNSADTTERHDPLRHGARSCMLPPAV